jgi:hypothetical protein
MRGRRKAGWCALVAALLLTLVVTAEAAPEPEDERGRGWIIMPRVGVGVEYGGFLRNDGDFTSLLRRRVEMDALQYGPHIFYLEFDEETAWGTSVDSHGFNRMRHFIYLGGYRYDLGDHYAGLYFYHRCHNPFRTADFQTYAFRSRENLYLVGLEFLTKTMRLGMKDRGIAFEGAAPFEFLGRFHYWLNADRVVSRDKSDLDWLLRARVRLDLFRFYWLIPYLEGGVEAHLGDSSRLSPSGEAGLRCRIRDRVDFTPFIQGGRLQEVLVGADEVTTFRTSRNYVFGGARLEFLLDQEALRAGAEHGGWQFMPEVHGALNYAMFLKSRHFRGQGKMELNFEALRRGPWTAFLYTDLRFDTRKEDFKPDKVIYRLDYGLTYAWDFYFAEAFVAHARRLDSHKFRGTSERSNEAGLRLGTKGMKPGHLNYGIAFDGPAFAWLHRFNAQMSASHFFDNHDWQYLWRVNGQARWDALRWRFLVPYVAGEINWLAGGGGTGDALEYAVEPGLRFHGVFDVALYYRLQRRENVTFFRGPSATESLIGLKAFF